MAHLSSQQNLTQGPTSHARNFHHRLRLQKQSLTTPSRGCRVHHAARATRHWELAATQWTEFESNLHSSTSPGESSARLPAGLRPHQHLWCHRQSTWSAQKGTVGRKGRQSVAAPFLQVTCASPTICNCLFHMFGLSMLPNAVKETAVTMASTFKKKRRLTNWPNIATCKTRHCSKFASLKLVQLAPRNFCHAVDGI